MGKVYAVGLGPGDIRMMTQEAREALDKSDVIVGYKVYTDLIRDICPGKEIIESAMRQEVERCEKCIELAREGRTVSLVCSGDAGVYGMASPLLEAAGKYGFDDIEIIPGVTAALSGAAALGAPLGHDFCVISLSDLLTPWDLIEKRLKLAAEADMCIAIYNPRSHKRTDHLKRAVEVMLTKAGPDRACGYVKNIGRDNMETVVTTLAKLADADVDMFTTVFVGSSQTKIQGNRLVTPRGYKEK